MQLLRELYSRIEASCQRLLVGAVFIAFLSVALLPENLGLALENPAQELKQVGLTTNIGEVLDGELSFINQSGKTVILKELLQSSKATVLVPAYYHCPKLCGLLLSGVIKLINELKLELGRDYNVVTVSFDPSESWELAKERADVIRAGLTVSSSLKDHWHFLVGDHSNVSALMRQIGFGYVQDGSEYAHTAAIFLVSNHGQIAQYFTGVQFNAWDLRLALIEASQGKLGGVLDQLLLFCFRYDEHTGRYSWAALSLARVVGVMTVIALAVLVLRLSRA